MTARLLAFAVTVTLCTVSRATIVDLTGSNNSGTINGAQFVFTAQQPTGTGVIQPFLRVENTPTEQGYNTSGGTRSMTRLDRGGAKKSLISLDQLQLYTSNVGSRQPRRSALLECRSGS